MTAPVSNAPQDRPVPAADAFAHPSLVEALGLRPFGERFRQALVALRGDEDVPASRYDLSSLAILDPRLALPLWAGRFVVPRRAVLTNLFNHRQTPIAEGWSVRRRQTEDFRGRHLTYDSHNGTDFAVPVGTPVVAPAAGTVVRVWSEYNRGGNKVAIDHGEGLITASAHLARTLVVEGQRLRCGEPFAVSGYSGLDGLVTFPFGIPHVHFNVWLDGEPVDPFARPGEQSLWLDGVPRPTPGTAGDDGAEIAPTVYDPDAVEAAIAACLTARVRDRLRRVAPANLRAAYLIAERNYYPTRFPAWGGIQRAGHARRPRLHMPFAADRVDGIVFADQR